MEEEKHIQRYYFIQVYIHTASLEKIETESHLGKNKVILFAFTCLM